MTYTRRATDSPKALWTGPHHVPADWKPLQATLGGWIDRFAGVGQTRPWYDRLATV